MSWVFRFVLPAGWSARLSGGWGLLVGARSEGSTEVEWHRNAPGEARPQGFRFVREVGRGNRDYESLSVDPLDLPHAWSRIDIVAVLSRRDVFALIPGAVADVLEDSAMTLSIDLADDYEREYGVCLARLARRGVRWELRLDGTGLQETRSA